MKTKNIVLLGALLLTLTTTCRKDPQPLMERFDLSREDLTVGTTTATIVGTYTYSGTIDGITVKVSKDGVHPTEFPAELNGKNFTVEMTGLHPATTYQYTYSVDYGFSKPFVTESKTFSTLSESPTVRTIDITKIDSTSIRVNCETLADGGVEISERGVCWNTYGDPNLDDEVLAYNSAGLGRYSCRINDLALSTKYYVRAYAKNATGVGFGEVLEFETGAATTLPQVSSVEVGEVTATLATFTGNVASDGGLDLEECGVCWSLNANPTISGSHTAAAQAALGVFQVSMTGLTPNKTYHARAYAKNAKGIAYGEDLTFTTTAGLPVVTTSGITEITATSAKGGGVVTDQGASNVTARGICWSTSHNPTTSSSHANNGTGAGAYTVSMTGLTPNATYYVRAYATNAQGTSYGAEVSFTALEGLPVVTTQSVTDITSTTAKGHGTVTDQGGSTVTERGVCWGTSASPTISGNHASSGTGTGSFTVNLTNLTPGTKYYVRAYAKNTQGTVYGEQKEFATSATLPTVTTASPSNVTSTTATGGGNVTTTGGATVTERGICWSTSHNPTTSSNHASSGTGTGSFTVNMTNLTPGTTYYVRVYAINSAGTAYGDEKSLTTTAVAPTVTTGQVSNITQTTAMGSGNVTASGGANVTERGVCWSTSHNPTISSSHQAASTSGTGSFTVNMTGLTANTHYYVRAYAKNSAGTSYGSEVDFTTSQSISAPTVTTTTPTNVTANSATCGGNVTSDGGATVTERGVCWSTSSNPTTSGSHQAATSSGTGSFTVNVTGLNSGTTYHVRAFAKNSAGTSYGSDLTFTTAANLPTVTTTTPTNITATTATGGGNVTSSGGSTIIVRGVCWSTLQNPTIDDYHTTDGSGTGSFSSSMTNLSLNTTYYVRAYATSANGTGYGDQKTFTTKNGVPVLTTASVTDIGSTWAIGGGNVTDDGGFTDTQRGVCWSTGHNPTISNNHASNGLGMGSYEVAMIGLTANTTYYVRAFATNSHTTAYGSEVSFTTEFGSNWPNGTLPGVFSVSSNQLVCFSQGNLQYKASTDIWRFADNQYDYIGSANSNISSIYSGYIDLFGWGTSGWDNGNTYYHPWDSNNSDGSLYGPPGQYNLTGSFANADWGVYNPISNGGNQAGLWRTPTHEEWFYLFYTRSTNSGIRYAKANVNNINGVILLPDDWSSSYYTLSNTNQSSASFSSNTIIASQWNTLEQHGAVFLPAAGYRGRTSIYDVGSYGYYWSASYYDSLRAWMVGFTDPLLHTNYYIYRYEGLSVRLVRNSE